MYTNTHTHTHTHTEALANALQALENSALPHLNRQTQGILTIDTGYSVRPQYKSLLECFHLAKFYTVNRI
jgi:hypothetical protein